MFQKQKMLCAEALSDYAVICLKVVFVSKVISFGILIL